MIDWLIEHYAEIKVYEGVAAIVISAFALVVILAIGVQSRRERRRR